MTIAQLSARVHLAEILWPFGQHKGKPVSRLPIDYVCWILDQPDFSSTWKQVLRQCLDIDRPDDGDSARPDPQTAAVRFPLIVWKWEQEMEFVFGDDPKTPEGAVVAHGRDFLRGLCSEVTGRPFPPDAKLAEGGDE